MRYFLLIAWFVLAAAWFSGIMCIAKLIGGYQWIEHTGQLRTVGMLALMGTVCAVTGLALFMVKRVPWPLAVAVASVLGIHFLNALGLYIFVSTHGHAGDVMTPFLLFSSVIPTTTVFIGIPHGNFSLFILPGATLLLLILSWGSGTRELERLPKA